MLLLLHQPQLQWMYQFSPIISPILRVFVISKENISFSYDIFSNSWVSERENLRLVSWMLFCLFARFMTKLTKWNGDWISSILSDFYAYQRFLKKVRHQHGDFFSEQSPSTKLTSMNRDNILVAYNRVLKAEILHTGDRQFYRLFSQSNYNMDAIIAGISYYTELFRQRGCDHQRYGKLRKTSWYQIWWFLFSTVVYKCGVHGRPVISSCSSPTKIASSNRSNTSGSIKRSSNFYHYSYGVKPLL